MCQRIKARLSRMHVCMTRHLFSTHHASWAQASMHAAHLNPWAGWQRTRKSGEEFVSCSVARNLCKHTQGHGSMMADSVSPMRGALLCCMICGFCNRRGNVWQVLSRWLRPIALIEPFLGLVLSETWPSARSQDFTRHLNAVAAALLLP